MNIPLIIVLLLVMVCPWEPEMMLKNSNSIIVDDKHYVFDFSYPKMYQLLGLRDAGQADLRQHHIFQVK